MVQSYNKKKHTFIKSLKTISNQEFFNNDYSDVQNYKNSKLELQTTVNTNY